MLEAKIIIDNNIELLQSIFSNSTNKDDIIDNLEYYIKAEKINEIGECTITLYNNKEIKKVPSYRLRNMKKVESGKINKLLDIG